MQTIGLLSIAGFDPSGGAGILADVKTAQAHGIEVMAVNTCTTVQNEDQFKEAFWLSNEQVLNQLEVLADKYHFISIKIGLVRSLDHLLSILNYCKKHFEGAKIVWDPILKASAGFEFHGRLDKDLVDQIMKSISLVTPNLDECNTLFGSPKEWDTSNIPCSVLLKGGHSSGDDTNDILYYKGQQYIFKGKRFEGHAKHGSGCVLSSAIAANLAKGMEIKEACQSAKEYIHAFLLSTDTLLGKHQYL